MKRTLLPLIGLLLLLLALWPPTTSLYGLTGEGKLPAQARGLLHWFYSALRPQPDVGRVFNSPGQIGNLPYNSLSLFGVNTFLEQEVLAEVREDSLQLARKAGFRFIRQEFPWEDIEIHGKGDFVDRRNVPEGIDAWAKYDHIVDLTEQYDLELIARLSNPPAWTRALTDTVGTQAPPDDLDDYGDFVAAVVGRYRGRITYFQLWNEPNIYPEWGEQPVNPEVYTQLLCAGYRRAKEVNPDAVILAGALAPTVALDGRDLNDLIFLERMYRAGAAGCFDILSAQGYGLWSGPTDHRLRPTVINYPHHLYLRDVMGQNGDGAKPIWISEMAWNVAPEGMAAPYGRVTEQQQAQYAVEAYQRAQREWPWVGVINYWFLKRPSDQERAQPWYYFRLLEPDFTPLPAFDALAEYMNGPAGQSVQPLSALYYTWQEARPVLGLSGLGLLFFWLLRFLWPVKL